MADSLSLNDDELDLQKDQTIQNTESSNVTKAPVSLSTIFPLPKIQTKRYKKGKRPSQKSEVITSSPFKTQLEEKEHEKMEQAKAKAERILETANKRKSKEDGQVHKNKKDKLNVRKALKYDIENPKPSTSSAQTTSVEEIYPCPGCGQTFSDDWIQCERCEEWWHEACSAYEGCGPFVCDHC